jgi:hypothetical protein
MPGPSEYDIAGMAARVAIAGDHLVSVNKHLNIANPLIIQNWPDD